MLSRELMMCFSNFTRSSTRFSWRWWGSWSLPPRFDIFSIDQHYSLTWGVAGDGINRLSLNFQLAFLPWINPLNQGFSSGHFFVVGMDYRYYRNSCWVGTDHFPMESHWKATIWGWAMGQKLWELTHLWINNWGEPYINQLWLRVPRT